MFLIASKMVICLIIATILGVIIGILLCKMCPKCHGQYGHSDVKSNCCANSENNDGPVVNKVATLKPVSINKDEVVPDDLKRIKGIGPQLEDKLNELGIYTFEQISQWSKDNVAWIDEYLAFKGRIDREEWIEQAKILSKGDETEFSKRYDS